MAEHISFTEQEQALLDSCNSKIANEVIKRYQSEIDAKAELIVKGGGINKYFVVKMETPPQIRNVLYFGHGIGVFGTKKAHAIMRSIYEKIGWMPNGNITIKEFDIQIAKELKKKENQIANQRVEVQNNLNRKIENLKKELVALESINIDQIKDDAMKEAAVISNKKAEAFIKQKQDAIMKRVANIKEEPIKLKQIKLKDMAYRELQALGKLNNIKNYHRMNKEKLIELLTAQE